MSDEGKKYILKLEAEALSFRDLLSVLIEVLDEVNNGEHVICRSGFTMTSNGEKQKYHYNIDVVPWEVK